MKVKIRLVMQLEIKYGSFMFGVPMAFYPAYQYNAGVKGKDEFPYDFSYRFAIESTSKLSSLILPEKATLVDQSDDGLKVVIESN